MGSWNALHQHHQLQHQQYQHQHQHQQREKEEEGERKDGCVLYPHLPLPSPYTKRT